MLDYKKICKDLLEIDKYAVTKLTMYYEFEYMVDIESLTKEDINIIIDFIHDLYLSSNDTDYSYSMLVDYVVSRFYVDNENDRYIDTQELLREIVQNGNSFKNELIDNFDRIHVVSF